MLEKFFKRMTNDYQEIPLFRVGLDLGKYKKYTSTESTALIIHPNLEEDQTVKERLKEIISHIYSNYNMDELVSKMVETVSEKNKSGLKEIPLFFVTFNLQKYKSAGEKGSCDLRTHPLFKDDTIVVEGLNSLIDHIRKEHNMEELV